MGPDKDEPGHDPNVCYGRALICSVPKLKIFRAGQSTHFWPTGDITTKRWPTATPNSEQVRTQRTPL
jgi:hypothetical protein